MPRARRTTDEPTFDPIQEELDALIALLDRTRLAKPGMTQAKLDAEKARSAAISTASKPSFFASDAALA